MATFGNTNIGSSGMHNTNWAPAQLGSRFLSPNSGTLTNITAYITVGTSMNVKAAIFSDRGGNPDTKIAESTPLFINAWAQNWYVFPISAPLLGGNYYWLVVLGEATNVILNWYDLGEVGQYQAKRVESADFVSPWGTSSTVADLSMSIYATYTIGAVEQWTLNIGAGMGGSVTPSSATGLPSTSTPTITATADANYIWNHWVLDGVVQSAIEYPNPMSLIINDALSHTLVAIFVPSVNQYTLTVQSNPSGIPFTIS